MPENNNKSFGVIIKEILVDKGLNQSVIAKKMNVSRQVINQIDRRKNFDYTFLKDLEKATGIDFTIYAPVPEYLKKVVAKEPEVLLEVNEKFNKGKTTTLAMNFEVPSTAYDNLSAFMSAINREADKYGIKVL